MLLEISVLKLFIHRLLLRVSYVGDNLPKFRFIEVNIKRQGWFFCGIHSLVRENKQRINK